jgi:hypothetical protein
MIVQTLRLMFFLALGAGLGAGYLAALACNVHLYCGRLTLLALSIHILRWVGTAAIFVALAKRGGTPLLSSFVGFELTRMLGCAVRSRTAQEAVW